MASQVQSKICSLLEGQLGFKCNEGDGKTGTPAEFEVTEEVVKKLQSLVGRKVKVDADGHGEVV